METKTNKNPKRINQQLNKMINQFLSNFPLFANSP